MVSKPTLLAIRSTHFDMEGPLSQSISGGVIYTLLSEAIVVRDLEVTCKDELSSL
jgi:hypothetical protein